MDSRMLRWSANLAGFGLVLLLVWALLVRVGEFRWSKNKTSQDMIKDIEAVLRNGGDINEEVGMPRMTRLHDAIFADKDDVVEFLLAKGANVNVSCDGVTPLMAAASRGQLTVAKLLMAKGADPNARNSEGKTALTVVEEHGDETKKVAAFLRQYSKQP